MQYYNQKLAKLSTVNARSAMLWDTLVSGRREYGIDLKQMDCGALVLNTSRCYDGSLEAGRIVIELSMGGLGRASSALDIFGGIPLPQITVESVAPAAACLDMQMAIPLNGALLSGPIRLFVEPLRFVEEDIPLQSAVGSMIAVVEQEAEMTNDFILDLARAATLKPEQLRIVSVSMGSIVGNTQIAGRAVEELVLTIGRSLECDPTRLVNIVGKSHVCPVYKSTGILLPDDFNHYTAQAYLSWVGEVDEDLKTFADSLCFHSVPCYGRLFSELLEEAGWDFWKIPNITHINKLSCIAVNDLTTGRLVCAGKPEPERLIPYLCLS